jgi:prepilin-type processing-associated H-X9-DG protein
MSDSIGLNATRDHTHSRKWKTWQNVLSDIQPDRFRIDPGGEDRTEGRANYLYADGHVESHTAAWLKEEIEAERNPAQPPLLTQ